MPFAQGFVTRSKKADSYHPTRPGKFERRDAAFGSFAAHVTNAQTTNAQTNDATQETSDEKTRPPTVRFFPHQDLRQGRPSLSFNPIIRALPHESSIIRVGRYSEREGIPISTPAGPSDALVGFKSKVVSRKHCEFSFSNGSWQIKDVSSSSGTFLNSIRLSQPNTESRLYPVRQGDIVQLGIDLRGEEKMMFSPVLVIAVRSPAIHRDGQGEATAETCAAPIFTSPRVSRIANGQVWESQATRKERARQELEAATPSAWPSTTAATTYTSSNTIDPSLSAYNDDNNKNSSHLDGPASSTSNFTPTANTFPVPIGPNTTTATNPTPTRFQNQDTHCLICLLPVTPSDIIVSDLRCVACPRIFHHSCLTYIPPRINQNWRCSLCYREAWHGYGHLAREREMRDPGLVERYRRRLLLANTYGGSMTMNAGLGQGGGRDGENVRFWFDVDMDGGAESDQAVLVRMGLVDMRRLRVLGDGDTSGRAKSLEEKERWGIALGMALQEEEGKVQELRGEVERLKNVVEQKDREIEELEGGL